MDEMDEGSMPAKSPEEKSGSDSPPQHDVLTSMLESTLEDLSRSIERMESILKQLEGGESDWEESVRLLSEANELALSSSQKLDRVVQDVVYGSAGRTEENPGDEDSRQQSLEIF